MKNKVKLFMYTTFAFAIIGIGASIKTVVTATTQTFSHQNYQSSNHNNKLAQPSHNTNMRPTIDTRNCH